jgi:hypothetical protein
MNYEQRTINYELKTKPISAQKRYIESKTNPIYRGVASGEAGSEAKKIFV